MDGPMIKRTNINKLFELGEERLEHKKDAFLKTAAAPMKRLIETAAEFGQCVKTCFEKKNSHGFCFDKKKWAFLLRESLDIFEKEAVNRFSDASRWSTRRKCPYR
jgi:hypothetical protein